MAQFVQFCVYTIANDATFGYELWRVVLYLAFYPVANALAEVQLLPYPLERLVVGIETGRLDGLQSLQGRLQLYHFTWRHTAHGGFRDDALQVANAMQLVVDTLTEVWFTIVILHDVQTLVDGLFVLQREHHPTAQHTSTHSRHRMVDDVEQRLTVVLHRVQQLQRVYGKLI